MQWWAITWTRAAGKLHDQLAIIQISNLLNIQQNSQDKTSLFLYFLRLYKMEMGTSSQKHNIIV